MSGERMDAWIALVCPDPEERRAIAAALEEEGWSVSGFEGCERLLRKIGRYDVVAARFSLDDRRAGPSLRRLSAEGGPPVVLSTETTWGHEQVLARSRLEALLQASPTSAPIGISEATGRVLSNLPIRRFLGRVVAHTRSNPDIDPILGKALRDLCRDAVRADLPKGGRFQIPLDHVMRVAHLPERYGGDRWSYTRNARKAGIDLFRFIRWCTVLRGLMLRRRYGLSWEVVARLFGTGRSAWSNRVFRLVGCSPGEMEAWKDAEIVERMLRCFDRMEPRA